MGNDYGSVLEQAKSVIDDQAPDASPQLRAAFANSVAYLVTGLTGGYGGPSMREHAVAHTYAGRRLPYPEAIEELMNPNGLIFGPLQPVHFACARKNHCFDDDPKDLQTLKVIPPET